MKGGYSGRLMGRPPHWAPDRMLRDLNGSNPYWGMQAPAKPDYDCIMQRNIAELSAKHFRAQLRNRMRHREE